MAFDTTAAYALILLAGAAVFWTWRYGQNQLERQRNEVSRIHRTAQKLLQAKSLREIDDLLRRGFTEARLPVEATVYFYRRANRQLETLDGDVVDIHSPQAGAPSIIATTFRNRVAVFSSDTKPAGYLVPMLAGEESTGVVLFSGEGLRTGIGLPSLEFLANHAAVAARALEQQAAQEQVFRYEKLATASQFVQAVAMELREVAQESPRAQQLVDRLLAMGRAESADARPIALAGLLNGIFDSRRERWAEKRIQEPDYLDTRNTLQVMGAPHQLEQVFTALLESAEALRPPAIEVTAAARARRARVEIRFSPVLPGAPLSDARRGLVQATLRAMGGELAVAETLPVRFEVELPLCAPSGALRDSSGETRTALVVESDATQRWQLVQLVAQRGIRVVPAESPGDALDRFEQFDFDLVFCPWQNGRPEAVRLLEHVLLSGRPVQTFVVAEADESGMDAAVEGRAFVLRKPVRDVNLFPLLPAS
jgi:signal transduction histidine kinase